MEDEREIIIGEVGIDSGQILLIDPCYIDSNWVKSEEGKGEYGGGSYEDCCKVTLGDKSAGEVKSIGGVASETGYGDGVYPVYAKYDRRGRITEIRIVFEEQEE